MVISQYLDQLINPIGKGFAHHEDLVGVGNFLYVKSVFNDSPNHINLVVVIVVNEPLCQDSDLIASLYVQSLDIIDNRAQLCYPLRVLRIVGVVRLAVFA